MQSRSVLIQLILPVLSPWILFSQPSQAQLSVDGTVGTTLTCTGTLCQVAGGRTVGGNLLQSFSQFDIGPGQTVEFLNPGVVNILARVTGNLPSSIQGELRVQGTTNLVLMNPNGISFGPGANLQFQGSFAATTADALELANGDRFSSNPLAPLPTQLLAVNPSAFLFNRPSIQPITSQGMAIQPQPGNRLFLVGGAVTLDNTQIDIQGGQIDLAGLAGPGRIGLVTAGNQWRLTMLPGSDRADLTLTNNSRLDVTTLNDGGTLNLYARNLLMAGTSLLRVGIFAGGTSTAASQAGDITVDATGWVKLAQTSAIQNFLDRLAVGNAGNILVQANQLSITEASQISALTYGFGSSGDVVLRIADTLDMDGSISPGRPSLIQSTVGTTVGNGGIVDLTARRVILTNGAQIVTGLGGQGDAGGITIQASDTILLTGEGQNGPSGLFSTISGGATGKSGDIRIEAATVAFREGGQIASSTGGRGDAGNVTIQATQEVSLDGATLSGSSSSIFSGVGGAASGRGGNILIAAPRVALTNGGQLIAATFGQGSAGNTVLQATETVILDGASRDGPSGIFTGVSSAASGASGTIQIQTPTLSLTRGGTLQAGTEGQGDAGNIQVTANRTDVAGSHPIFSDYISGFYTFTTGDGQGGTIHLNTGELTLQNGAVFDATTSGAGAGGQINVTANILQAGGGAQFLTSTSGSGNAGSIQLTVDRLILLQGTETGLFANTTVTASGRGGDIIIDPIQMRLEDGASISVNSAGQGPAGNILIAANRLTLNRSSITAATASGEGGNITLRVPEILLLRNGSLVSATANGTGNGGNLEIQAGFVVAIPDENSDIIANAFRGRGGTIKITTQGIFGINFQPQLTLRSDITASSEFGVSGVVTILEPDLDPSQGVTALPGEVLDASSLVAQGCATTAGGGRFVVTGRGGLPMNPTETLSQDATIEDVRLLQAPDSVSAKPSPLINNAQPARSWLITPQGDVKLLAEATPIQCPTRDFQ